MLLAMITVTQTDASEQKNLTSRKQNLHPTKDNSNF